MPKDIQLPNESGKRDPRLPKEKPSIRRSLDALKRVSSGIQKNADDYKEFQRRNR